MILIEAVTTVIAVGLPPLPAHTGAPPPWPYKGYASFPAHFFGANETGQEPESELALIAKHQFVGWGWQQDLDATSPTEDGHYYSEETASAQAATRLASYVAFSKANGSEATTQGIFVYRHSMFALSWYSLQRAAYTNSANADFWVKGPDGKACVATPYGGPTWNFSNPGAADFFVDEIVGELTREADINAVFFDETDAEYCGFNVTKFCTGGTLHIPPAELAGMYRDKIEVLRRSAAKLNAAGIWPMFSSFNELGSTRCALPYEEYYGALKDVGWFRFYEFFGVGHLANYLAETAAGLPVVVHDAANLGDNLALAAFLLGQGDYGYFGSSNKSAADGWTDGGWTWHAEYDAKYGEPLGPATQGAAGWSRQFSGCSVLLSTDLKNATITMKDAN